MLPFPYFLSFPRMRESKFLSLIPDFSGMTHGAGMILWCYISLKIIMTKKIVYNNLFIFSSKIVIILSMCILKTTLFANDDMGKYLLLNKSLTPSPKATKSPWYLHKPDTINQLGIDEIISTIGTKGNKKVKLGFSYIISYFSGNRKTLTRSLENLLVLSQKTIFL